MFFLFIFNVFSYKKNIKFLFLGDIFLGGRVQLNYILDKEKISKRVLKIMNESDYVIGNLECVLTYCDDIFPKSYNLYALPELGTHLEKFKIDAVTMANNHTFDFNSKGFEDTKKYLKRRDIKYTGAGNNLEKASKPAILGKINNKKILLFGFSDRNTDFWASKNKHGTLPAKKLIIKNILDKFDSSNYFKIVYFHYGNEYQKKVTKKQKELSKLSIDFGADIVVGTHAHVSQRYELYKSKPIFYGLGNFLFDIDNRKITKTSIMPLIKYNFKKENFNIKIYKLKSNKDNYFPEIVDVINLSR